MVEEGKSAAGPLLAISIKYLKACTATKESGAGGQGEERFCATWAEHGVFVRLKEVEQSRQNVQNYGVHVFTGRPTCLCQARCRAPTNRHYTAAAAANYLL